MLKVFTVAIACTHKGQQYTPKEALDTAAKRIKEIEEGRVRALECNQPNPRPKPKPDPKRKRKPRRNRQQKRGASLSPFWIRITETLTWTAL